MNILQHLVSLSTVTILLILSNSANTFGDQLIVDDLDTSDISIIAERRETDEEVPEARQQEFDPLTGLSIVDTDIWLVEPNLPWSQLVMIRDENHNEALAVLDRDYEEGFAADFRNPGVITQWQRHHLEVYGYGLVQTCLWGVICDSEHPIYPVSAASLKVGEQIFDLQPKKNLFLLTEEVAWALKNAPLDAVWIRVAIAGGSNFTTREISADTVRAWRELYQDVEASTIASLPNNSTARVVSHAESLPTGLVVVEESRWRFEAEIPCSEPVIIHDSFEGDYLAVLDREYSLDSWSGASEGILTNWSRHQLAIHLFESSPQSYSSWATEQIALNLDGKIFLLHGSDNIFPIDEELYRKLGGNLQEVPLITYPNMDGELVTREIGSATVLAWKTIYPADEPER